MAASWTLFTVTLLLGAMLSVQARRQTRFLLNSGSSNQRDLLKEVNNEIEHGPDYSSHHKQHHAQNGHKEGKYHVWANKMNGGLVAKKPKYGRQGEHQMANTKFDNDDIALQRLDFTPIPKRKKIPKSLSQMAKKKAHKPSKKIDKMYKKMLEKDKLHLKKSNYEKLHKKKQIP